MKHVPEVRAPRENKAVEVVGGAHDVDDDIGETAGVEALHLDVVAEGGDVAIQCPELTAGPVVVGVWRGRDRHFHLGPVGAGLWVLELHAICDSE